MRALALLATLLVARLAYAGYVNISATLDGPATGYTWHVGCTRPGQYELPQQSTTLPSVRIEGLPDAGKCYFAVRSVLNGVSSELSEEAIFDFDRLAQIPSTPTVAPTIAWSLAPPPPSATVLLERVTDGQSSWDEYFLTVTGSVQIALLGGTCVDWVKLGAAAGGDGGTTVPTTPALGGNNDGRTATSFSIVTVARARTDFDCVPFNGGNVTSGSATQPLVRSGSTWTARF